MTKSFDRLLTELEKLNKLPDSPYRTKVIKDLLDNSSFEDVLRLSSVDNETQNLALNEILKLNAFIWGSFGLTSPSEFSRNSLPDNLLNLCGNKELTDAFNKLYPIYMEVIIILSRLIMESESVKPESDVSDLYSELEFDPWDD